MDTLVLPPFNTLLMGVQIFFKYVQVQMGNSSSRVTLDIYDHLLKDANPEAAAKTDALIFSEDAQAK